MHSRLSALMACLTKLPFEQAKALAASYGLVLLELQPLSAGSVNSNFFLTVGGQDGEKKSLFARIYEEQGAEGACFELDLNDQLSKANIPVARPLRPLDGSAHAFYQGKPFAIYQRLKGEVLCQKRVTAEICFQLGAQLAAVHQAPLGQLKLKPSRFGMKEIRERLETVEQSGRASLLPAVARIRALSDSLEVERAQDLPQGLIHGDLFRDNVLIEEDSVSGLLDFESASQGNLVYDLMVTLLAWCFGEKLDLSLCRGIIHGYSSVRPLSAGERGEMEREGSVACLRFATTRLTDFSLRTPDGQAPQRDYARFFERLDALQSGVLSQL